MGESNRLDYISSYIVTFKHKHLQIINLRIESHYAIKDQISILY